MFPAPHRRRPRFALPLLVVSAVCPMFAAIISPDDPAIRYVGRFDRSETPGPRCAWSASAISFTVSGGSVRVRLKDGGKNLWQIVIDGEPASVLKPGSGEEIYPVARELPPGAHRVELVKRTEAFVGTTQFLGLEIDDSAQLLPASPRVRRIEVIGDSISCGYGNEAPGPEHPFSPATENAWLAYGAVAARAVQADYVCIAWSGKKLWPDNRIVDLYGATLPTEPSAAPWDFTSWSPDVIVINLGTNDFYGRPAPDPDGWVDAYLKFIARLRALHPRAVIYCALGTMLEDRAPALRPRGTVLDCLRKIEAAANAAGSPPVRLIDFGVQSRENGIGANWHPSTKTHALMGEQLAAALRRDLGW